MFPPFEGGLPPNRGGNGVRRGEGIHGLAPGKRLNAKALRGKDAKRLWLKCSTEVLIWG